MAEPQDRPDIQVFTEIGIIEQMTRANVAQHLPPGVSYAQFEFLMHLTRAGDGQTPAQIAQAMHLTKGAVTNTLQRLEAQGFVSVLADVGDRRKKRVKLTRKGIEAKAEMLKRLRPSTEALRDGFTEAEFRAALPFLKALRAFLDEMRSERPDAQRPAADDAGHFDRSA